MEENKEKQGALKRVATFGKRSYDFVTQDMWRLRDGEVTGFKGKLVNMAKVIYISVTEFNNVDITQKSQALTYKTLLSVVPFLAIMLAIAAGFGVRDTVQEQLFEYLPAHRSELSQVMEFVRKYLEQMQNGVIIGVGIIFLLYTVIMLLASIEDNMNDIWHINKPRSWSRRLLSYLAAFFVIPILMTLSSGVNVFINSMRNISIADDISLSPLIAVLLQVGPYIITIGLFTTLYLIMPYTKVKFTAGLIAGIVSGTVYQIFQMVYISGQLWVSKYNAIYGSFAAIPLLLMFLQVSWTIFLFGVQLSYSIQNVERYAFKAQSENISRRFVDFVAILCMERVCKAFKSKSDPYTAERLAKECDLPITIVNDTLAKLVQADLLIEHVTNHEPYFPVYYPNLDIHEITVGRITGTLDRLGSEDFKVDIYDEYSDEWEAVRKTRFAPDEVKEVLVIDL